MCTASWIHDPEGYHLLFNRDEKRTRKQAVGPQPSIRSGVRFLAPTDGDCGGTWIAANEFGVSVCLLNGANLTEAEARRKGLRSRGLLLPDLISEPTAADVCERVRQADLSVFEAFTIVAVETGKPAALVEWNGVKTTFVPGGDLHMPLTSSSFDTAHVRQARRDEFARLADTGAPRDSNLLFAFHNSHHPARSAYSACMHRPDAQTMSLSWIRVTASGANFRYHAAAPCVTPDDYQTIRLPMRRNTV